MTGTAEQTAPPVGDPERAGVTYTPVGSTEAIRLTTAVVRKFFCDTADEVSALAFMGFCKHSRLNPFLREVYLSVIDGKAVIQVAYTSFMQRAERNKAYKTFRAGIVLLKQDKDAVEFPGEPDVTPPPFVAIQGELKPPGYVIVGGWCKVWRKDRHDPILAVVDLKEYQRYTWDRDSKQRRLMKNWAEREATMIRKVAVGHGHRDAFTQDLAGWYLEGELPTGDLPREPVTPPATVEPTESQAVLEALFERLGWNRANRAVWLAQHPGTTEEQAAQLQALVDAQQAETVEIVATTPAAPVESAQPALPPATTDLTGKVFEPPAATAEPVAVPRKREAPAADNGAPRPRTLLDF